MEEEANQYFDEDECFKLLENYESFDDDMKQQAIEKIPPILGEFSSQLFLKIFNDLPECAIHISNTDYIGMLIDNIHYLDRNEYFSFLAIIREQKAIPGTNIENWFLAAIKFVLENDPLGCFLSYNNIINY